LIIGSTGLGVFLYTTSTPTASSSTSGNSAVSSTANFSNSGSTANFKINYDNLTVGYNSGLWSLSLTSTSGKQVKLLTAILSTPAEAKLCTGELGGFYFGNCPATPPFTPTGTFLPNATFTGYAAGIGPGSAKVGNSYKVTLDVVFADGTNVNDTLSVTATSSG
jgi:hypothetical protein